VPPKSLRPRRLAPAGSSAPRREADPQLLASNVDATALEIADQSDLGLVQWSAALAGECSSRHFPSSP
jgi:hypothetical protein